MQEEYSENPRDVSIAPQKDTRKVKEMLPLLMALAASSGVGLGVRFPKEVEERPCVNCGKPKRHSNAFCSKECCWDYKNAKKAKA